ncbi:TetR/AcrR family transcriptional regulator [Allorhizocola rhizosphaerae]|uniref:TetR/AcrR family transcriptional regulator n=1 Tax=Allorhizocola rhizosphaerae TaxID=1872709 RepID=UPI000E3E87D3|nr:TetR/AcrR family transcriptional regulator [Allorhizocola rhizosphaerae]
MTTRPGRPPLTERRKEATRLDIARAAVQLFTAKGVTATTAEEIAAAAGISVRTLWRYFPSKESCVMPLLTTGAEGLAHVIRAWPSGAGMGELIEGIRALRGQVTNTATLVALVRLTRKDPQLRGMWLQAHAEAERVFAAALGERAGQPAESLPIRVQAAMIDGAIRAAVEFHAWHAPDDEIDEGLVDAVRIALGTAAKGVT